MPLVELLLSGLGTIILLLILLSPLQAETGSIGSTGRLTLDIVHLQFLPTHASSNIVGEATQGTRPLLSRFSDLYVDNLNQDSVPKAPKKESNASSKPGPTYGDPPFYVRAVSNSPGIITYSLVSGKATVTPEGLVTLAGTGLVTIQASQASTVDYTSTLQQTTFFVAPASPAITFTVSNQSQLSSFPVSATSNSTGTFTYSVVSGPATISGNIVTLTGQGQVVLQASQAADDNYTSGKEDATFTVDAPVLTVEADNLHQLYGASIPTFTGSIKGAQQGDLFVETFSSAANTSSQAGHYLIIPLAVGQNLSKYAVHTVNGVLTIAQAPTVITLNTTSAVPIPGQAISLLATVISTTTGTPSGSVSFYERGTPLQTVPLSGGYAQLLTQLSSGTTHLITASYSGDVNYLGSSTATSLALAVPPLDFTFTLLSSSVDVVDPGKTASYTFQISPLYGSYAGPITFTITGLPTNAIATITPSTLSADAGPANIALAIQTAPLTAKNSLPLLPPTRNVGLASILALLFISYWKRRTSLPTLVAIVLMVVLASGTTLLTGCATVESAETPHVSSISIVANSGAVQHTQTVSLTVQ